MSRRTRAPSAPDTGAGSAQPTPRRRPPAGNVFLKLDPRTMTREEMFLAMKAIRDAALKARAVRASREKLPGDGKTRAGGPSRRRSGV